MITNFDYLKNESKFSSICRRCHICRKDYLDGSGGIVFLTSRRAMEFAVKWMYSVDDELEMPYQDNLQSLMNVGRVRQICSDRYFGNVWIIFEDVATMLLTATKN